MLKIVKGIDSRKTKKEVENVLERFKRCKRYMESEELYGGVKNEYIMGEPREDIQQFIGKMNHALDGLTDIQRELILERYILGRDGEYDYIVQDKIQVAHRTYYRIKKEAMEGLAISLGIEVYK